MPNRPWYILPVIIFSQFAGTSLWFAGNAVVEDIILDFQLSASLIGNITSAVQFGFIAGTITFALLLVADRFNPSLVFFICAIGGSIANGMIVVWSSGWADLLFFRFLTGFFLAGVYPVGMKIAADWFDKDLGKALGFLVGALVLGTAFPHLLKAQASAFNWRYVLIVISILSASGGLLLYTTVKEGPFRKKGSQFNPKVIWNMFKFAEFRSAAFGYFGHMWELYTFWTFVPLLLVYYQDQMAIDISISLWCFLIIGIGSLGCIFGGIWSTRWGSARVAFSMLLISCLCSLLSFSFFNFPFVLFMASMLIWGFTVVGDSAQFSSLSAKTAPPEYVGSALTVVTSIGFSITIVSIELLNGLRLHFPLVSLLWILGIGPILGLLATQKLIYRKIF